MKNLKDQQEKAKDWNHRISAPSLDPKEIKLKVSADHLKNKFAVINMNKRNKMFNIKEVMGNELYKTLSCRPKQDVVKNLVNPSHFQTMYRHEFVQKPLIRKKRMNKVVPKFM